MMTTEGGQLGGLGGGRRRRSWRGAWDGSWEERGLLRAVDNTEQTAANAFLIGRRAVSFVYASGAYAGRAAHFLSSERLLSAGQELVERGAKLGAKEGRLAWGAWAPAGGREPQNPPMPHTVGLG